MTRRQAAWGAGVFLLAAGVRAVYVLYAWSRHGAALEFPDEELHWSLARHLFAQGALVSGDGLYAARMPAYPLMLALFAWAGDGGMLAAKLGQALLGGLTAWIAYAFAREALDGRAAVVAGLLVALDPYLLKFSELLLTETLFTCIGVGLAWMSWRLLADARARRPAPLFSERRPAPLFSERRPAPLSQERQPAPLFSGRRLAPFLSGRRPAPLSTERQPAPQLAKGSPAPDSVERASVPASQAQAPPSPNVRAAVAVLAILGPLAVLTRPSSLGWVVLLWMLLALATRPFATALRRLALYMVAFAFLMLPWGLRNKAVLGDFAWLGTNGGITLYDALGPQADGSSDQSFKADLAEVEALAEVERDRAYRDLAMKQVRKDPAPVLRLAGVKFSRTWNFLPNYSGYRGGAAAWISAAWMVLVVGGAVVGMIRKRRYWPLLIALLLPVLYFTAVHSVYIGSVRYRVPLMPFLEILAGASMMRVERKLLR